MKYLSEFNELTNYMVDNYSFKLSREHSKKQFFKDRIIFNEKEFKNKFDNFLNAWNKIKSDVIKFKYRPEMRIKSFYIIIIIFFL